MSPVTIERVSAIRACWALSASIGEDTHRLKELRVDPTADLEDVCELEADIAQDNKAYDDIRARLYPEMVRTP
jgi:hypothetical protein